MISHKPVLINRLRLAEGLGLRTATQTNTQQLLARRGEAELRSFGTVGEPDYGSNPKENRGTLKPKDLRGRLGAIRTRDLPLRRRLLYPSELRAHIADGGRRPNGCVQDLCPPRLFYRSRQRAMLCAASAGRRGIRGLAGSNSWNEPRGASRIWHSAFIARREPRPARSPRRTAGFPRPGRRSRAPCVCRDAAGA